MTTFSDDRLDWRQIPTREIFGTQGAGYQLERAGYRTLGAILAASEATLMITVPNVGPVRVKQIRERALAAAKAATPQEAPAGTLDSVEPDWPGEMQWFGPEMLVAMMAFVAVFLIGLSLGFGLMRL